MKRITLLILAVVAFGCGQTADTAEPVPAAVDEPEQPKPGDDNMVLIPAGEFQLGSDKDIGLGSKWYAPAHTVNLDAYYIDAFEVTFEQFLRFSVMQDEYTPEGDWQRYYATGKEMFPVSNVSFDDAVAYCEWAGKRLPTEAEWERAARGPEGFDYPWGNEWDVWQTFTNERGSDTVSVLNNLADKSPDGVYGMMGNVQEWVSDKFKAYKGGPNRRDAVFRQNLRSVRGASYALKGEKFPLFGRMGYLDKSQYGTGFRCAKDAEESPAADQQ